MQGNMDIAMAEKAEDVFPVLKKKRIRRRMVNGVLVSKEAAVNNVYMENTIHGVGEDCQCKRFRCFEMTTAEERVRVFTWFRKLGSVQMQDLYLSNLITVEGVKQRRRTIDRTEDAPGKKSEHSASYFYKLKIPDADQRDYRQLNVCRVAFLAILGISRNRLRLTQKMLYNQKTVAATVVHDTKQAEDLAVPEPLEALVMSHIDNYALSEMYRVKEMHKNFLRTFRINVPYNTYWVIFHAKWNIAKFNPRYTCLPTFDTFYETLNMFGLVDFGSSD